MIIYIKDLVVLGRHGAHPQEKIQPQSFNVSVELTVRSGKSVHSDKLADTIDWSVLRATIEDIVENKTFNLVERLAQAIAEKILKDQRIKKVVVSIDKIEAFESGVPGVRLEVTSQS